MVLTGYGEVYSLHQLTNTEIDVIFAIIHTADRRCFDERDEDGNWYSNDDFVLKMNDEQRKALANLGESVGLFYSE